MSENNPSKPLSEQDKQIQPIPGEIDPKDAKNLKSFWQYKRPSSVSSEEIVLTALSL